MMKPFGQRDLPKKLQESFLKGLDSGTAQIYSKKPCIVVDAVLPTEVIEAADKELKSSKNR